jgi:hypothetical protein
MLPSSAVANIHVLVAGSVLDTRSIRGCSCVDRIAAKLLT